MNDDNRKLDTIRNDVVSVPVLVETKVNVSDLSLKDEKNGINGDSVPDNTDSIPPSNIDTSSPNYKEIKKQWDIRSISKNTGTNLSTTVYYSNKPNETIGEPSDNTQPDTSNAIITCEKPPLANKIKPMDLSLRWKIVLLVICLGFAGVGAVVGSLAVYFGVKQVGCLY